MDPRLDLPPTYTDTIRDSSSIPVSIPIPPSPSPLPSSSPSPGLPSQQRSYMLTLKECGLKNFREYKGRVTGDWTTVNKVIEDAILLSPSDSFETFDALIAGRILARFSSSLEVGYGEMKKNIGVIVPGRPTEQIFMDYERTNAEAVLGLLRQNDGRVVVYFYRHRAPELGELLGRGRDEVGREGGKGDDGLRGRKVAGMGMGDGDGDSRSKKESCCVQ